jgi:hypothetical protein
LCSAASSNNLIASVATARQDRIDIQEVARRPPVEQSVHFPRHDIIGVQNRTNIQYHRRVSLPEDSKIHLATLTIGISDYHLYKI